MYNRPHLRPMVNLELIICTHNRQELLARALESVLQAPAPSLWNLRLTVVDNNSTDGTGNAVKALAGRFEGTNMELHYLFEPQLGKSFALNRAVEQSSAAWLAFIDDDEELFPDWFQVVERLIRELNADYFSGVTRAHKNFHVPSWVPESALGVVFGLHFDPDPTRTRFEVNGGIAIGGNLVIRRELLERVGPYDINLGRVGCKRIFSCEDHDMSERLARSGACGYFVPELQVYHHVPPERQSKFYFRRWYFDHAISAALLYQKYPDMPRSRDIRLWRRPRHVAVRLFPFLRTIFTNFEAELRLWELLGLIVGSWFHSRAAQALSEKPAVPLRYLTGT